METTTKQLNAPHTTDNTTEAQAMEALIAAELLMQQALNILETLGTNHDPRFKDDAGGCGAMYYYHKKMRVDSEDAILSISNAVQVMRNRTAYLTQKFPA
jgi:hypothetical protein